MLLKPNIDCQITHATGEFDHFGQPLVSEPVAARCAIVKLLTEREKTSVRADSSASRGSAHEITADARLLFPNYTEISENDLVAVAGISLQVVGVFPRYDMAGRLDHYQVDLNVWA